MKEEYSFCESAMSSPLAPRHIRKLTAMGRRLGGGADTNALCGLQVSWDNHMEIKDYQLSYCCQICAGAFIDSHHGREL